MNLDTIAPDSGFIISNFPAQIQILSWDKTKENFCPVSLSETDFERFSVSLQLNFKAISMKHPENKWLRVSKSLKSLNMLAGESVCCELRSWAYRIARSRTSLVKRSFSCQITKTTKQTQKWSNFRADKFKFCPMEQLRRRAGRISE